MYKKRFFCAFLCCVLFAPTAYCTSNLDHDCSMEAEKFSTAYVNKICFKLNNSNQTATVLGGNPNTEKDCEMHIPSSINSDGITYQVTEIADKAFFGNFELSSIIVEGELKRIGNAAFDRTNLIYMDIHHGVDEFGENVFLRIPNYAQFIVPEGCAEKYSERIHKPIKNQNTGETYFFEGSMG